MVTEDFCAKIQMKKNHKEKGENSPSYLKVTVNSVKYYCLFLLLDSPLSMDIQGHKYPLCGN